MDIAFGILQDGTENMGYDKVLYLAISLKTWAFVLCFCYIFIDYKFLRRGMTFSEKERIRREELIEYRNADPLTARPVNMFVTKTALGLLFSIVVTAWVIFFKYLIE
uniref:MFS general substrate transporter n=1 Tax=Phaffia rhodozyma TaxID=264483 RepID=A0A1C9U6C0_PHARH|nr:MFS general substrate transporter [Phaffia rhodozyma]